MKKVMLICATIALVTVTSIVGCRKESQLPEKDNANVPEILSTVPETFYENITVNEEYGFLQFANREIFEDYRQYLLSTTHAEVQEYLNSMSFTSLGHSLYGEEYQGETVTEEEVVNYMFNEQQVFQVEGVIMKPIEETEEEVKWPFLLTMKPEYLSEESYEKLAAGTYDENTMNKFATNPEDEERDILVLIEENPTGYEETEANETQARRPMFGTRDRLETICTSQSEYNPGGGGCIVRCKEVRHRTTYIFWIGFPHEDYITSSWTQSAPC